MIKTISMIKKQYIIKNAAQSIEQRLSIRIDEYKLNLQVQRYDKPAEHHHNHQAYLEIFGIALHLHP